MPFTGDLGYPVVSATADADVSGDAYQIKQQRSLFVHAIFSGGDPRGFAFVQASGNPTASNSEFHTHSGTTVSISGATNVCWNITTAEYPCWRFYYSCTSASTDCTVKVYYFSKGVSV